MSATTTSPRAARRSHPALRLVFSSGGWANALILLGMALGPLLALAGIERGKASLIGLVLAATCTMLWTMLAGGRLVGLFVQSARLRLPRLGRQAALCAATTVVLVVLLPAMVVAPAGGYALAAAALATAVALGLFWVSMPPWTMWVLIAAGVAARWLPGEVDDAAVTALFHSPGFFAAAAALLLAASALCWWWLGRHRRQALRPWSTPLALAFAAGVQGLPGQSHAGGQDSPWLAQDTPVGSGLRREPQQALAIALGPGFGRHTPRNVLAAQGPVLAVAVFWLMLGTTTGGRIHIGLTFAPLMVLSAALAPMLRLLVLYARPALGLHELALLPGLPRRPALSLASQLGRQAIARSLPALAVMAGFGLAVDAPPPYYLLLVWVTAASLFLLAGATLLALHSGGARLVLAGLTALVTIAVLASMLAARGAQAPSWLLQAWSAALLAGVALHGLALSRLQARPHPWLQN